MTAVNDMPPVNGGFRHMLRAETRQSHDGAEAVFDRFHANPVADMTWFLSAQRSALVALSLARAKGDSRLCDVILEDLIERLDFDLALRAAQPVEVVPDRALTAIAVDYLVLGSRLGTEVLRRRLFEHMNHNDVPTYFLAPSAGALWQRHCGELNEIVPGSAQAMRVLDDVTCGFDLFTRAARTQISEHDRNTRQGRTAAHLRPIGQTFG